MYDVNKCEWVSECTLIWKDACYLNKRPTIMCLAQKKQQQNNNNRKPDHHAVFFWRWGCERFCHRKKSAETWKEHRFRPGQPSIETKVMSVRNASHQVTRRSRQSTVKIMSGRNASQQVTGASPQPWKIGLATFCWNNAKRLKAPLVGITAYLQLPSLEEHDPNFSR